MNNFEEFTTKMKFFSLVSNDDKDYWYAFSKELCKYWYEDIFDRELLNILREYETIRATYIYSLSVNFSNFSNDIRRSFELPFEDQKIKRSSIKYIFDIVEILLDCLEINQQLIFRSSLPPSLIILSEYIDEFGFGIIDELLQSDNDLKTLLALNLLNCQSPSNLTQSYRERVLPLLSCNIDSIKIQSMKYFCVERGIIDVRVLGKISQNLMSVNTDVQWNALYFIKQNCNYFDRQEIDLNIRKFLQSDDEEIVELANSILSNN